MLGRSELRSTRTKKPPYGKYSHGPVRVLDLFRPPVRVRFELIIITFVLLNVYLASYNSEQNWHSKMHQSLKRFAITKNRRSNFRSKKKPLTRLSSRFRQCESKISMRHSRSPTNVEKFNIPKTKLPFWAPTDFWTPQNSKCPQYSKNIRRWKVCSKKKSYASLRALADWSKISMDHFWSMVRRNNPNDNKQTSTTQLNAAMDKKYDGKSIEFNGRDFAEVSCCAEGERSGVAGACAVRRLSRALADWPGWRARLLSKFNWKRQLV